MYKTLEPNWIWKKNFITSVNFPDAAGVGETLVSDCHLHDLHIRALTVVAPTTNHLVFFPSTQYAHAQAHLEEERPVGDSETNPGIQIPYVWDVNDINRLSSLPPSLTVARQGRACWSNEDAGRKVIPPFSDKGSSAITTLKIRGSYDRQSTSSPPHVPPLSQTLRSDVKEKGSRGVTFATAILRHLIWRTDS
ncbi:hypothetical protein CPB86DRAFT_822125 [Serendipita vermifera]|nr:hypothetical protein CPB86DRAFT_822125 [Serendipita vermifera]